MASDKDLSALSTEELLADLNTAQAGLEQLGNAFPELRRKSLTFDQYGGPAEKQLFAQQRKVDAIKLELVRRGEMTAARAKGTAVPPETRTRGTPRKVQSSSAFRSGSGSGMRGAASPPTPGPRLSNGIPVDRPANSAGPLTLPRPSTASRPRKTSPEVAGRRATIQAIVQANPGVQTLGICQLLDPVKVPLPRGSDYEPYRLRDSPWTDAYQKGGKKLRRRIRVIISKAKKG